MKKYRVIVAGDRDLTDQEWVNAWLDYLMKDLPWDEVEVVCGEARGADTLGKNWAKRNNINVASFPAEWDKYGRSAGPIRNGQMRDYGTHLIAFWAGPCSKGTTDMIRQMDKAEKPFKVIHIDGGAAPMELPNGTVILPPVISEELQEKVNRGKK